MNLLRTLTNFKGDTHKIGSNCALIPRANGHLGNRRIRTQLLVGISHALAYRVDTNLISSLQEINATQVATSLTWTNGVQFCPLAVGISRQQISRIRRLTTSNRLRRRSAALVVAVAVAQRRVCRPNLLKLLSRSQIRSASWRRLTSMRLWRRSKFFSIVLEL